jgi:hypothetical protein
MHESHVGKFFRDSSGKIYKMISYCAYPTATFMEVGGSDRKSGAVGSPILIDLIFIASVEAQNSLSQLENQLKATEEHKPTYPAEDELPSLPVAADYIHPEDYVKKYQARFIGDYGLAFFNHDLNCWEQPTIAIRSAFHELRESYRR